MATEDEIDTTVEGIGDDIEAKISETRGSDFVFSQHDSIAILSGVITWCRDRIQTFKEELGDDE